MYRLIFQNGRLQGKRLAVRQAQVLIGRDLDCHIPILDDPDISLKHAFLEEDGGSVYVIPLTSRQVLKRNGEDVSQKTLLHHDDVLTFGGTHIQFQDIIPPQIREGRSHGLIQPLTFVAIALIVVFQVVLLIFLIDWDDKMITAQVERTDRERAIGRAQELAQEKNEQEKLDATSMLVSPGAATGAAPAVDTESLALLTQASPPAVLPDADILDTLTVADFAPVHNPSNINVKTGVETAPHPDFGTVTAPPRDAIPPELVIAQQQLSEAVVASEFAEYDRASRIYKRLHRDYPDFLPAYTEHARMEEVRGDFQAALNIWSELMKQAEPGSTTYRQALDEHQRIMKAQAIQTTAQKQAASSTSTNLPGKIRVNKSTIQKMPNETDIDEMRILHIPLRVRKHITPIDSSSVQILVTFYDQDQLTGNIRPTRAITPRAAFSLDGGMLQPGDSRALDATYTVPDGFRAQERAIHGEENRYYGYVIRVFVNNVLQDVEAKPTRLQNIPLAP